MAVTNRVRELREKKGRSQGDLGMALHVSRQTINAIETGKYNPSLELALLIAKYFELSVEEIFSLRRDEKC